MPKSRIGVVLVNTGEGKGKTSASLGLMLRAWGHGLKICVIQFIKHEKGKWGESKAAAKLGIDWLQTGDGFLFDSKDLEKSRALAKIAWETAQERISSGDYDLVILDEFTYLLHYHWLETADVIQWFKDNKPPDMHLVITGRFAPEDLIAYADTVTEMKKIKHNFDQGNRGQKGIEF